MKSSIFFTFLFLVGSALGAPSEMETSICTIISLHPTEGQISQCTGFVSGENAKEYIIMTCNHGVLPKVASITHVALFHHPTWKSYILNVKAYNKERDVCVFAFDKKPGDTSRWVWKLNPTYKPQELEKLGIWAVTPNDGPNFKYSRFISNVDESTLNLRVTLAKGNSGGVVFNAKREAIGILSKTSRAGLSSARRVPIITQAPDSQKTDKRSFLPSFP